MSEVFVSYKREDEARVSALVAALERHGLACWWDRGVVAGENWRARLKAELDEAGAVLVVWTKISAGSHGMFVQGDASHAQRRGKLCPCCSTR
ncbi:MAG: toll/interleukin-1 receptor domain-containing protein [Burkholderiales bacterium]|nr:toll/interleukin-1 receptor domain-containing protein [Burkholderiales bacterium]